MEDLIQELNETWQDRLGVQLKLWRWEGQAVPGFGADAQDVVNRQMPPTVDVFIGVLWAKIGTPTKREESGTLEEFEWAYSLWQRAPTRVHLLLYFKSAAVEFDQIDPDQIKRVRAFQKSLPERGGFYWRYQDAREFETIARKHLQLLAQRLAASESAGAHEMASEVSDSEHAESEEEAGLLDLVDEFLDAFAVVTAITEKFSASTLQLNDDMRSGIGELTRKLPPAADRGNREAKRTINSMAGRLDLFAEVIDAELPVLDEAFAQAMRALDSAIEVAPDFGDDGIAGMRSNRESLLALDKTLGGTGAAMQQMSDSIQRLPRITTRFNRSKRRAVETLRRFCASVESVRNQLRASLDLLDEL